MTPYSVVAYCGVQYNTYFLPSLMRNSYQLKFLTSVILYYLGPHPPVPAPRRSRRVPVPAPQQPVPRPPLSPIRDQEENTGLPAPDTPPQQPVDTAPQAPVQQQVDTCICINVYVLKALNSCDFHESQM